MGSFFISSAPHIRSTESTAKIMYWVIIALIPAAIGSVYIFGMRSVWMILAATLSAVITEYVCQKWMKKPITIYDGSAILTGLLLAFNLPAEAPLWIPVVGSFVGIFIGKQVFGGLGYNPLNPALVGRAFLMASWPVHMTSFQTVPNSSTLSGIDSVTSATPLNLFKSVREILTHGSEYSPEKFNEASDTLTELYGAYENLFLGKIGGCIGETSALLLLIGALFLMYKRIIGWKIPLSFIGTVFILTWIFGGHNGYFTGNPVFHILSGGLILGAFYMATDMVTTPVTFKGRLLFGLGCGILTVVIRLWGGYPEGVSYAILLMNLTTPLLNRSTRPKTFGGK